jgi:hypothetical protein
MKERTFHINRANGNLVITETSTDLKEDTVDADTANLGDVVHFAYTDTGTSPYVSTGFAARGFR